MKRRLTSAKVASMYIGVIIGAGFSSGRECWQFFGVFGKKGFLGASFMVLIFVILALMLTYVSESKGTSDLGKIISPLDDNRLIEGIGYLMAGIYYTLIIAMSAAAGALLEQQFGIDSRVGGIAIVILTYFTVIGDFERLSAVFNKVVPLVFGITMLVVIITIFYPGIEQSGPIEGYEASPMASNWMLAAIIFTAYNGIGMIPMAGACAVNSRDRKSAYRGAFWGSFLPAILTILLLAAILRDMAFSNTMSLPLVGYASRISKPLGIVYTVVLFGSMYATASSTFYAFSTKIKKSSAKKYILLVAAIIGFMISQFGFKTLVKYLYPPQGYIGIVIIIMITVNFIKEWSKNNELKKETSKD
ncbi:MAG: hypothetical protein GX083_03020 [Clostridiales bacterium]|nr:hypothetical protein [Clostridiales bacterium]